MGHHFGKFMDLGRCMSLLGCHEIMFGSEDQHIEDSLNMPTLRPENN